MTALLCICGASDAGKTYLLERLIPELTRRGLKVGAVKHNVHGFQIDHQGRDSYRLFQAGAYQVAISYRHKLALIGRREKEMPLRWLVDRYMDECDLVLAEGFKQTPLPKIEVYRREVSERPICMPDRSLLAVVGDDPLPDGYEKVKKFPFAAIGPICDWIESWLKERLVGTKPEVRIEVDGRDIPLNRFVQDMVGNVLLGIINSLRGRKPRRKVTVSMATGDCRSHIDEQEVKDK
jgi:molybdopterin-guanine dinucleotide biosynthesis protein B